MIFAKHKKEKLANNKQSISKIFFNRIRSIDIFGFADQDKVKYGLGYTLTLKRFESNNVSFRAASVAQGRVYFKVISWYAENFTPSLDNQHFVADQMLTELPTELFFEHSFLGNK